MKLITTTEYCPHCDNEHDIIINLENIIIPLCPTCSNPLVPCTLCTQDNCGKMCPDGTGKGIVLHEDYQELLDNDNLYQLYLEHEKKIYGL